MGRRKPKDGIQGIITKIIDEVSGVVSREVSKGINKVKPGLENITDKGKKTAKYSALKVKLIALGLKRERLFAELGSSVYNLFKKKKFNIENADFKSIIKQLKTLEKEQVNIKKMIKNL